MIEIAAIDAAILANHVTAWHTRTRLSMQGVASPAPYFAGFARTAW